MLLQKEAAMATQGIQRRNEITQKNFIVYTHPYIDRTESNSRQRKRRPEHVTVKFLTTSI